MYRRLPSSSLDIVARAALPALLLSAMAWSPCCANAQQPAAPAATPAAATGSSQAAKPPDLSREALVIEKQFTRIREEADGTGTREQLMRVRIVADAGVKDMAVLVFTYTADNEQVDVDYVRVLKPDGSVVVTPPYNIQDLPADVSREAPMYSDIHQKHVAVKGLGVGDTLEYKVTTRTIKPEVPGHFWVEYSFQKDLIVLDEQLDLDLPEAKNATVASADLQPTVTASGGRKLYHWASSNLARPDPDAPPKSMKKWKPSVQVTTFASWEQVGAWYASLQKDQVTVTPAIQARADALTKGLTAPDDKIRAIFQSVAMHTHYVGLDFGIGRYQPHPADDVLSNEYGDCKDKHTLLAALLKAEGIEAWPVLISSSRYLDPAIPSPAQFDHVITVVPRDGKLIWMDSTAEVAPVGIVFASLRDKQALAIPPTRPAYLERTPAALPFAQSTRFETVGKLSDKGVLTAHITQTLNGDAGLVMRILFRSVPQSRWKEFLQRMTANMGFGGEVKEPDVSPIEQIGEPLRFTYDYTREKFSEWDDHRIQPAIPWVGIELAPGVKQIKPADDVDLGSPGELVYTSKIEMPSGYQLYPPKDTHLKEDWATYDATYTLKDNVFTAERRLVATKDKVPLADWEKYLDFRRGIYVDEERTEALMSRGDANIADVAWLAGSSAGFQVTELVAKLKPLVEAAGKLSAATPPAGADLTAILDTCHKTAAEYEAHSLEFKPEDVGALWWAQMLSAGWTAEGWAEFTAHDLPAAENHLRAAWKLSQSQIAGYLLAQLLEARGEKAEAAHLYELASIAGSSGLDYNIRGSVDLRSAIADAYKKLTGKTLTATALGPGGSYNGSLRAELDKDIELRHFIPTTKLTGQALYQLTFEPGKPTEARMLSGETPMGTLAAVLKSHKWPAVAPAGSTARVTREVKLICSPWGGCDAYVLLPSHVETPSRTIVNPVTVKGAKGTKTVEIVDMQ